MIILLDFKKYYKATVMKRIWYWHRYIGQCKRIQSLEIDPKYSQLVFHKEAKNTQWEKNSIFSKSTGKTGQAKK